MLVGLAPPGDQGKWPLGIALHVGRALETFRLTEFQNFLPSLYGEESELCMVKLLIVTLHQPSSERACHFLAKGLTAMV